MKRLLLFFLGALTFTWGYSQNLQISGGNNFSVALCDNAVVYAWGSNAHGQMGLQSDNVTPYPSASYTSPQRVYGFRVSGVDRTIKQVDGGSGAHAVALDCNNNVWVWGNNNCGQVGVGGAVGAACPGGTVVSATPARVLKGAQTGGSDATYLSDIKYVSGGNNASYAIVIGTGEVLAWGENGFGQLGDGSTTHRSTPVYVQTSSGVRLTNIIQIEGGDDGAYALDASGNVWSWGTNANNELARPLGAGAAYAGKVQKLGGGDLTGITQLSVGDTHGLALDGAGNVWSWGGDWGKGQLGQGDNYQNNAYASKVVEVGGTCSADKYTTGPYLTGVKYIAAGQASSSAVLANGNVVSWGSQGFFNCGAGNYTPSGVLGNGSAPGACTAQPAACTGANCSECPVYVKTNSTTNLSNIVSVSDGDAWYFAVSATGQVYTWGFNGTGELGIGNTTSQPYATALTLPSGCAVTVPCPVAALGADFQKCPTASRWLYAGTTGSSYSYTWYYKATLGGTYSIVSGPILGAAGDSLSATALGYYKVEISDNRAYVSSACGACAMSSDEIIITELPNPYTVDACEDIPGSLAKFSVTAPLTSKIKWYTNYTGGSALNPTDSNLTITVPFSSTNTSTAGCTRALFAEDVSTYTSALRPGTTVASAPCSGGTAQINGDDVALMIDVNQNITLTNVSFVMHNYGYNYSANYYVEVCNNNPTGNWCGDCSPAANADYRGATCVTSTPVTQSHNSGDPATVRTLNISIPLTGSVASPTKYWIRIRGGEVRNFSCSPARTAGSHLWATPQTEPRGVMRGLTATQANNYTGNASAFNIAFSAGTGYACGRILVCVSSNCVLPVEYQNFTAEKQGFNAFLNWATASEKNSAYFIVEKSSDGISFSSIGRVEANGNSTSVINYSFLDTRLGVGTSYYRLAQYDLDGQVHYSEIRSLSRDGIRDVKIVPNPNNGSFTVFIEGLGENANVKLTLRNALSQVVYEGVESTASVSNVNIQHLPSAIYFLEVQTDEGKIVTKVVKE